MKATLRSNYCFINAIMNRLIGHLEFIKLEIFPIKLLLVYSLKGPDSYCSHAMKFSMRIYFRRYNYYNCKCKIEKKKKHINESDQNQWRTQKFYLGGLIQ